MLRHDYTAKQALNLLVSKVESESTELAKRIRLAIDVGSEVQLEEESGQSRRRGPKSHKRFYRKTGPYSPEEALSVAVGVVRSHLLESRAAVQTAFDEFTAAAVGPPVKPGIRQDSAPFESSPRADADAQTATPQGQGTEKAIEIETEPETVRERTGQENLVLKPDDPQQLESLHRTMEALENLTSFEEAQHGNTSGS